MLCDGSSGSQELGTLSTCTTSPSWLGDRHPNPGLTTTCCACVAGWCLWTQPMVSRTGRYAFCLSKDWQTCDFAFQGLAGTFSVCQGAGRHSFCLSRDQQVHFLPFKQMAGTLSLPFKDWQVHFVPFKKACTSKCMWSVLTRNDCKLA